MRSSFSKCPRWVSVAAVHVLALAAALALDACKGDDDSGSTGDAGHFMCEGDHAAESMDGAAASDHANADHANADADGGGAAADHNKEPPVGPPSGATCPKDNTLTYDNFGKGFMTEYCVRCHSSKLTDCDARMGAPYGHDFDTFPGIVGVAEHIDEKSASGPDATNTSMPNNGKKPTLDERKKLGQWLACELAKLN